MCFLKPGHAERKEMVSMRLQKFRQQSLCSYRLKVIERDHSSVPAKAKSEFEMRVKRKRKSCSSLHQKLCKNLNLPLLPVPSGCSHYPFSISLPASDFSFILINSLEGTTWIRAIDWFCCLFKDWFENIHNPFCLNLHFSMFRMTG